MKSTPYDFWKRVDEVKDCKLTDLADKAGVSYTNLKNQRSLNRYPRLEDAYAIAVSIDSTVEYLMTGQEAPLKYTEEINDIIKALLKAPEEDLELVRRALRMPGKNLGFSKEDKIGEVL